MQGQRSSISALPENVFLDNGSLSVEPIVATQIPWNSSQTSEQSWPPHTLPLNTNSFQYMQQPIHGAHALGFSLGESSSSSGQHHVDHSVRIPADTWNFSSQSVLSFGNQQHFQPSNTLSLDNNYNNAGLNLNSNQTTTTISRSILPNQTTTTISRSILPNPVSNPFPRDLSASLMLQENNNGQVIEHPKAQTRPSNNQMLSVGSSSNSLSLTSEWQRQCTSRKRKAFEINAGRSSGEGTSNHFENGGRNQRHCHIASSVINNALPRGNGVVIGNGSERASSRLGPGTSEAISSSPGMIPPPHLWVNGLPQQSVQPGNSSHPNVGNVHAASSGSLGSVPNNRGLVFSPAPVVENANLQGQTLPFHPPPVHRNLSPPMWNSASATRYGSSSVPGVSNPAMLDASAARNNQRNPMIPLIPDIRNLNQNPANLNWGVVNVATATGNIAPSQGRPVRGVNIQPQAQHTLPQYLQGPSGIARRSPLPSVGIQSGGQGSTNTARASSSRVTNQAMSALLVRRLNTALGLFRSLRTSSARNEGVYNVVLEVRHIINTVRRGEAPRLEDIMYLEQFIFLAMTEMNDSHRDLRMDVDNMSYEELLALEERIGNVCTGLSEEAIMKHMKQQKYVDGKTRDQNETEPCSICREEYNEGEDLATLECGHDFHRDCIKQWLMQKNLCPICKTTGLNI